LQFSGLWSVILGGSSGFGLATVEKLASQGMNIALLYRETSGLEKQLKQHLSLLAEKNEVTILPFNINALEKDGRDLFLREFKKVNGQKKSVRLLLHSIARGNLKPLLSDNKSADQVEEILSSEDLQLTTYAMSHSLLEWARLILKEDLFCEDGRIIGLTSEGAHKYWEGYAAVSLAKSSLESLAKYMAVEFAKYGLKTNIIQAGISETPSFHRISGSKKLIEITKERNPFGRITLPSDIANVIYLLCLNEAVWINGALIHVDGGEHCR